MILKFFYNHDDHMASASTESRCCMTQEGAAINVVQGRNQDILAFFNDYYPP